MTKEQREKVIEELVQEVDGWDFDTLLNYAMDRLKAHFDTLSDEALIAEYNDTFDLEED